MDRSAPIVKEPGGFPFDYNMQLTAPQLVAPRMERTGQSAILYIILIHRGGQVGGSDGTVIDRCRHSNWASCTTAMTTKTKSATVTCRM